MKIIAALIPILLSIIAVLLGLIWHKMPGKENMPALDGEYRKFYTSKGSSQAEQALKDRVLRLGPVDVGGRVSIDDTSPVRVSLDRDVKMDSDSTFKVEIRNDRPIPVLIDDKSEIHVKTWGNHPINVLVDDSNPVNV